MAQGKASPRATPWVYIPTNLLPLPSLGGRGEGRGEVRVDSFTYPQKIPALVSLRFLPLLCRVRETNDIYRLTLFKKSFCVASATGWSENREFSKPTQNSTEHAPAWARLGVSSV